MVQDGEDAPSFKEPRSEAVPEALVNRVREDAVKTQARSVDRRTNYCLTPETLPTGRKIKAHHVEELRSAFLGPRPNTVI